LDKASVDIKNNTYQEILNGMNKKDSNRKDNEQKLKFRLKCVSISGKA
jgi:hypothetical protein